MKQQQEQQKEHDNVTELRLVPGGKPPVDEANWLANLPRGTHFLWKKRSPLNDIQVSRAVILYHFEKATLLLDNLNQEVFFCVDTAAFSSVYRLLEVIAREELPSQEEVQKDATADGAGDP